MAGPQLALLDLGLQRPHQRVAFRIAHVIRMAVEHELERLDLLAHEFFNPVEFLLELRLGFKIPTHDDSSSMVECCPADTFCCSARLGLTRGFSPISPAFTRARFSLDTGCRGHPC